MTVTKTTTSNPAIVYVVFAVTMIVVVEILASVSLTLHGVDTTRIITLFAITTGSVIPSLFAIVKIGTVESKVDEARDNTAQLLNGELTERIHSAVHTVLESHGVPQLQTDNVTGETAPHDNTA